MKASQGVLPSGVQEEGERDERVIGHLQGLLKKHLFEMTSPVRPLPHQIYREIFIPLDFKPKQRDAYKGSLVKYYAFLKDEGIHRYPSQ